MKNSEKILKPLSPSFSYFMGKLGKVASLSFPHFQPTQAAFSSSEPHTALAKVTKRLPNSVHFSVRTPVTSQLQGLPPLSSPSPTSSLGTLSQHLGHVPGSQAT